MDRTVAQKDDKIRQAARWLAAISQPNQEAAQRFVDWKIHRDRRRTSSAAQYAQLARDLDRSLSGKPYHLMTHEDGDRFTTARAAALSELSLDKELNQVRHFLKWQMREHGQPDLVDLPYRLRQSLWIRAPKKRVKKEIPMTREDLDTLLAVRKNDPCTQALYWLCYDAGLRVGEALVLNVRDFDIQDDGGALLRIPNVEGAGDTDVLEVS